MYCVVMSWALVFPSAANNVPSTSHTNSILSLGSIKALSKWNKLKGESRPGIIKFGLFSFLLIVPYLQTAMHLQTVPVEE